MFYNNVSEQQENDEENFDSFIDKDKIVLRASPWDVRVIFSSPTLGKYVLQNLCFIYKPEAWATKFFGLAGRVKFLTYHSHSTVQYTTVQYREALAFSFKQQ